ncbi:Uncharacterised protein [Salmonella enterica subsp. enterica serovar Typhi]|nr:Uncharacterised protein [Salmonella enterica subsp. enterica serovar Typhi]CGW59308.1 Uncharacterised protein [Salmonella enterica subsp. enterica serovar Typhi]CGY16643.1 Uncharacterised protein [Salmonella enterica subsp. enterica serovar Typhi]CQT01142.1 Uncharacterised protein [Salmonella enterica subsp. enterica serovar Typhi]
MAIPGFIHRNRELQPLRRHVDRLPPQRTIAGLHHGITFTGDRRGDMQFHGVAWTIIRFIQFEGDAIRTRRAATVAVILPAIAGPETNAADRLIRRFDLQTVRAPFHREADFSGFIRVQIQRLLALHQIFLIKLRLPAFAFRPVPVIVATLADEPHL